MSRVVAAPELPETRARRRIPPPQSSRLNIDTRKAATRNFARTPFCRLISLSRFPDASLRARMPVGECQAARPAGRRVREARAEPGFARREPLAGQGSEMGPPGFEPGTNGL